MVLLRRNSRTLMISFQLVTSFKGSLSLSLVTLISCNEQGSSLNLPVSLLKIHVGFANK